MKLRRILQVGLTIFYGQLLSVGIYDNLLAGIPALIKDADSYFNIARVVLGVFIIATSILSLIVVWNKAFKLIFATGVLLVVIFLMFIVVSTIHLTQVYDKLDPIDKYQAVLELVVKAVLIILAVVATFFMASRGSAAYSAVPSRETAPA